MTLLNTINRISAHHPGSFICPIFDADVTEVSVMVGRIPYRFLVRETEPGWWVMRTVQRHRRSYPFAIVEREAYPSEYFPFLEALPRFYVIALYRLSPYTWLTVPFSVADAEQRGWEGGMPRQIHLVSDSVGRLDMIDARQLDDTLIYADIVLMASPPPNRLNADAILAEYEAEMERRRREAELVARQATLQGRLEEQLKFANAKLLDWREAGEAIRVTWVHRGETHSMIAERSGRIRSSGVCLSGRDGDFNLSAIVGVMEERDEF